MVLNSFAFLNSNPYFCFINSLDFPFSWSILLFCSKIVLSIFLMASLMSLSLLNYETFKKDGLLIELLYLLSFSRLFDIVWLNAGVMEARLASKGTFLSGVAPNPLFICCAVRFVVCISSYS
jgi:hypothetical protein